MNQRNINDNNENFLCSNRPKENKKNRYKRINFFKSELDNYRYYQYRLDELREELELVEYEQSGVKGISYGEYVDISNQTQQERDMKKILLIQRKGMIERKLDDTKRAIEKIDNVLTMMSYDLRWLVMRIYILKNSSYKQELNKFNGYSLSSLQRTTDNEIYRCIKNSY